LRSKTGLEVIAAGRRQDADLKLEISDPHFAQALKEARPDVVVHCVGPFQGQDYSVAHAALAADAHYLDLADGRRFVSDFASEVDVAARRADRIALSGASTLPALSSAVVDALSVRFGRLDSIEIVIAPGQRAPRGAATLRAVFGYCGKSFKWLDDGRWQDAWGWQELQRVFIERVGRRLAAACDVPDLELFPARYPGVRAVQFRAALEFAFLHWALWGAAAVRKAGMPLPIERWAAPMDRAASWLDGLGGAFGGMLIRLRGEDLQRKRAQLEWHLSVDALVGPDIPCIAAILLAHKLLNGGIRSTGAFPCMGFLRLDEFEPEFQARNIRTWINTRLDDGQPYPAEDCART
jgi:hypothetical protein